MTIGVCVLTYNGAKHLPRCLPPLLNSPLAPRVLAIDSSSSDGSSSLAKHLGAETLTIPKSSFNHGLTRQKACEHLQTDIVVMVTQDAYAKDQHVLEKLTKPLLENQASAAYARQLPHQGAGFFESFHRHFNYPQQSEIRSLEDLPRLGRQIYFCSNSFAAYNRLALNNVGGFQKVLLGEDTVAAAKLLHQGHKIAYVAEAEVYHSHSYSLWEEFKRHFDTGYARKDFADLLQAPSGDECRGKKYAKELLKETGAKSPHLLPYAVLLILSKWAGYRCGRAGHNLPNRLNSLFSGHPDYFRSLN